MITQHTTNDLGVICSKCIVTDSTPLTTIHYFNSTRRSFWPIDLSNICIFIRENVIKMFRLIGALQRNHPNYDVGFLDMIRVSIIGEIEITRYIVLCVCFVDHHLSFCAFSVGQCVVCSSSIYDYLVTSLVSSNSIFFH